MANEISLTIIGTITNGNFKDEFRPGGISVTQTTLFAAGGVQSIGTTEEALAVGDVATLGYAFFRNVDATNFVTIGTYVSAVYYPAMKLKAGEAICVRLDSTKTYYAKADTAAVKLLYKIWND